MTPVSNPFGVTAQSLGNAELDVQFITNVDLNSIN